MGGENVKVYHRREPEVPASDAPFVVRMLSQLGYGLMDFAGVRVVCGFLSDIERFLQAMRVGFRRCGMRFDETEVERWLDCAQADGYRGVHVNVRVPLKGLLPEEAHGKLVALFKQYGDDGGRLLFSDPDNPAEPTVLFPCEIQLRTAYQDSWARASHEIQYKRPGIREDLHEHMHSLSGLLFNSDEIMDLVRETIEADDPRHVALLKHLRNRLHEDAFWLVQFAAEYAREFHKDDRLYGGRPHYNHLLSAADCLVRSFRVDDPLMLVLAFFQDLWMDLAPRVLVELGVLEEGLVQETTLQASILQELKKHFDTHAASALVRRLRGGLPKGWPCHDDSESNTSLVFGTIPIWFRILLANCLKSWHTGTDERSDFRLSALAAQVEALRARAANSETKEGRDRLTKEARDLERRACVLETAIQLSRLDELPADPHRPRAIREFQVIYGLLERIRRRIGDDMRLVLREAERMLRATADRLEAHLPIDWEA